MYEMLMTFFNDSGFGQFTFGSMIMIGVGLLFIFLAIRKGFEPLLLVPIGFGILIGNIPYNREKLSIGVYDGPVSEAKLVYYATEPLVVDGKGYQANELIPGPYLSEHTDLVKLNKAVMVHSEEYMVYYHHDDSGKTVDPPLGVHKMTHGGHEVFVDKVREDHRYRVVIPLSQQDIFNASVFWMLFRGIEWGFFPPLIFLGVGALTDFGPLLAKPKLILLGAAAQLGIFGALICAVFLGFDLKEAASIGIIGGADGPTAIFTCSTLAPHLLGAVALSAYSYMAMVPLIQPPIMRFLTTKEERLIRMAPPPEPPKSLKVMFPIAGFILTAFIANGALSLLGMLFFGNLLRESLVTDRLAKTAQTTLIDIVTILLGLTVGAKTQASNFLTWQTIGIFALGIIAFSVATAGGVLFAKLMNAVSKDKINPLIGAAGVSAVPMAARVAQRVAHEEDRQNFVLMHAMGPNVAGVIGSAVAAGVLLSYLQ
ncbi:sodium ion-translocating decarboxylase subunit beta [bacterium]|nr:sodium ion-translocating decarboxylase subunit beta [bacterium]